MILCDKCLFFRDDLGDGWVDCIKKGKTEQRTAFCENYIFRKMLMLPPDTYVKKWDDDAD
ncbi:hypothetical protein [Pelosinus sp. sgz500959]|uniref:hypothetical protein n=1 Tax=Pelosinus sp. sgz500959 TaxID=3242472 RepID=UPI00366B7BEC